jgi:predicted transcriptional regulator of viral defense system
MSVKLIKITDKGDMMTGVASKIKNTINHMKSGSVFPINSLPIDPMYKNAAEKELSRLVEKGELQRFRRGVYYKPAKSIFFGNVLPNPTAVATAIAELSHAKIVPYGPMALHMLGLTTQVPMKQVYLNDKLHKTEMVGNTPIIFKRVSSKKLLGAGKKAGLVLSALEYLSKEEAQDEKLQSEIAKKLNAKEKLELEQAAQAYPKWLREIIEKVVS